MTAADREFLVVSDRVQIPRSELTLSYARSGGPGGQHVNKTNTKVILHWDVSASDSLPPAVKRRFLARYTNRISSEGLLQLSCDTHRTQLRNREECFEKLAALITAVLTPPKPRKPTKPSKAARARRMDSKHARGKTKQMRKPPSRDD